MSTGAGSVRLRVALVLGVVVLAVGVSSLAGAAAGRWSLERWSGSGWAGFWPDGGLFGGDDCPVETTPLDVRADRTVLVPADQLDPVGSAGDDRAPTLRAARGLAGDLGLELLAGRFSARGAPPTLVDLGDRVLTARPPTAVDSGEVSAVTLPDGGVDWATRVGEPGTVPVPARGGFGGGRVGQDVVLVVPGADATSHALVAFDPATGERVGCVAVPSADGAAAGGTLVVDQADEDVVVAAAPVAAPVRVSRVTPESGDVRWTRELDSAEVGAVTAVGESLVTSRVAGDPVRLAELADAGGIGAPTVQAYDLADGTPTWSFPRQYAAQAAMVLGSVSGAGAAPAGDRVVTLVARPGRRAALVTLDGAGSPVWRRPLPRGFWSGGVWGDLVVVQGADPAGGPMLRAFSLERGAAAWVIRASAAPARGAAARRTFGVGVEWDGALLVPAPNGLLRVEPATGRTTRLDSAVPVDGLSSAAGLLLMRMGNALLVVGDAT